MDKYINTANWDRIVRVVAGLALIGLGFFGVIPGVWGIVAGTLGIVFLLTGIVGVCPLYMPFGFHTNK